MNFFYISYSVLGLYTEVEAIGLTLDPLQNVASKVGGPQESWGGPDPPDPPVVAPLGPTQMTFLEWKIKQRRKFISAENEKKPKMTK